jgi:hypothetical protein
MPEGRLRPRELAPALPGDRRGSGSATAFETKSAGNEARPSLRGASPRQQFLDQWPASQSYDKTWRRRGGSAGILLDVRLPRCWPDLLSS